MKFREDLKLEVSPSDVCDFLTEIICDHYASSFNGMEIWRITRTKHGKFILDLMPKPQPVKRLVAAPASKQGAANG